ncbi:MAG: hypothetical protein LBH20_02835 [Treponema sp.]|jgi:hypothetical protein|nr:hypothetical protein [Treponema sp.]
MKTTINALKANAPRVILLLAAIVVLAALSCAPEVELSKRDWKEVTADKDATKLSINMRSKEPGFSDDINSDNEVTITLPNDADVLRESNANIAQKMSDSIKFYAYTKGVASTDADSLGAGYTYSFVSRKPGALTTAITVKINIVSGSLVARVLATKYTFAGGKQLGAAGDTKAGTEYYDVYKTIRKSSEPGDFLHPYKSWTLDIVTFSPTITAGSHEAIVATSNVPTTMKDTIMGSLVSKLSFKVKKFNGSSWQDVSGANFTYNNTGDIRVTFTPEDLQTYRVEVGGVENLTVGTWYGVTQRMRVTDHSGDTVFTDKTAVSNAWTYIATDTSRILRTASLTTTPLTRGLSLERADKGNKNVVLKLSFNNINVSGTFYYPSIMSLSDFNKNFKIFVYTGASPAPNTMAQVAGKSNEILFLDIKKIEYTGVDNDNVILELNSDYRIDTMTQSFGFLVAPGVEYKSPYSNSKVILGNYNNWEYEINGVRYFDYYGSLPIGNAPIPPAWPPASIQLTTGVWANGSINTGTDEVWYKFPVTSGTTYYVWWNDDYAGDGSKTLDVVVSAYYSDETPIFTATDSGWSSPQSFTASSNDTVYVMVESYDSGDTGTYGIVFNTSGTRP